MNPVADKPVVPYRDLDQDREPSGPSIRCPLCGWSPRKEDKWFYECGHSWNTFDTGGVCQIAPITGQKRSASHAADGRRFTLVSES
jgi:hypothetical protein